jgi:hypothetical protein
MPLSDTSTLWTLSKTLSAKEALPANPFLADLRTLILQKNAKRCPKWAFRFADDLVMQLQPQPTDFISEESKAHGFQQLVLKFLGRTVHGSPIPADPFSKHVKGLYELRFRLYAAEGDAAWTFKVESSWGRLPLDQALEYKTRVVAALPRLTSLDPAMMFRPACVICGKLLTDPVSMARWIGPECFGRGTIDIGKLFTIRVGLEAERRLL